MWLKYFSIPYVFPKSPTTSCNYTVSVKKEFAIVELKIKRGGKALSSFAYNSAILWRNLKLVRFNPCLVFPVSATT